MARVYSAVLLVSACIASVRADGVGYELGPVIGIFSVPSSTKVGQDYIPKSYVDWVQAAGGRVMPLPSGVRWNKSVDNWTVDPSTVWTPEQYEKSFQLMNGLLLPGGNPWPIISSPTVRQLLALARNASARGDYFPVWGTCAGFETLLVLSSGETCQSMVMDGAVPNATCDGPMTYHWKSSNMSLPQKIHPAGFSSRLFSSADKELLNAMASKPIAANFHRAGADPSTFASNPELAKSFRVLSSSVDSRGKEFVATVEGVDMPWYGTQWHPEKPAGEWGVKNGAPYEAINHSPDAIRLGQYLANFLIGEASRNSHGRGRLEDITPMLIMNYVPTGYNPHSPMYVQRYEFDWAPAPHVHSERRELFDSDHIGSFIV